MKKIKFSDFDLIVDKKLYISRMFLDGSRCLSKRLTRFKYFFKSKWAV